MNKIESIQKRALQLFYNDFKSNYSQLLDKAKKITMEIARLRRLCLEIYKTINRLNPAFMTEIFQLPVRKENILNLKVTRPNQVRYGERSFRVLGPKIWNNLSAHVKSALNLLSFKRLIKSWDGISCKCTLCKKL